MDEPRPDESEVPESTGDPVVDAVLARYAASIDEVCGLDPESLVRLDGPSTGLHALGRAIERGRRRFGVFDTKYVCALEAGGEPARYAKGSTKVFLRDQLRISHSEAARRVAVARACGPRPGFSGQPLPPRLPALAAAIDAGEVSSEHAAVVVKVIDTLPDPVRVEHGEFVEDQLVDYAKGTHPGALAAYGVAVLERADPDGALRDDAYAKAHRSLTVTAHKGRAGGTIRGELTPVLFDKLVTIFDPLAAPHPETADGVRDDRPADARTHDALETVADHILASGDLPACGGTPTTVVIHIREQDFTAKTGFAITDHGTRIPVPDALLLAQNSVIYSLVHDAKDVPLWLGRTSRLATPGQTIALAARDRGCSFPGCDRPPAWCQRHHVTEWAQGGPTNIDTMTLVCGYHHREHGPTGWKAVMINGQPYWIPPAWIDPHRTPIRNHAHQHLPDTG